MKTTFDKRNKNKLGVGSLIGCELGETIFVSQQSTNISLTNSCVWVGGLRFVVVSMTVEERGW